MMTALKRIPSGEEVMDAVVRACWVRGRADGGQNWAVVDVAELLGRRRWREVVFARRAVVVLCRRHTAMSFPEIAGLIRGDVRKHATIVDQHRIGRRMLEAFDPEGVFTSLVAAAERELEAALRMPAPACRPHGPQKGGV